MRTSLRSFLCVLAGTALLAAALQADARPWRINQYPNGTVLGCGGCHTSSLGGGPRNAFGQAVGEVVSPGGQESFWTPALAMLDSDEDGAANGAELGDPDGTWQEGDPNPQVEAVYEPGNADSTPPLQAEADAFIAVLLGANEVPPVTTRAHGWAIMRLSPDETTLDYYLYVFDIENLTGSHIHIGGPDENGGVIYPLELPEDGSSSGSLTVNAEDVAQLRSSGYYVNVHTEQNPPGEIRGQIEDEPLIFAAELSGEKQNPPVETEGSGTATVTLSEDLGSIAWTVSVSGLEGVTMAHFHEGAADENGGVLVGIADSAFDETSGEADIDENFLDLMLSKQVYVNVHTEQNPPGEIRGQVLPDVELNLPPVSPVEEWSLYR